MTPAQFGKLIADETEKWGKMIGGAIPKNRPDLSTAARGCSMSRAAAVCSVM